MKSTQHTEFTPSIKAYKKWRGRDRLFGIHLAAIMIVCFGGLDIIFAIIASIVQGKFVGTAFLLGILALIVGAVFGWLGTYFKRQRVVVTGDTLTYRKLLVPRTFKLENISAILYTTPIATAVLNRSRAVLIVSKKSGGKIMRLSEGLWDENDLTKLATMIGAEKYHLETPEEVNRVFYPTRLVKIVINVIIVMLVIFTLFFLAVWVTDTFF